MFSIHLFQIHIVSYMFFVHAQTYIFICCLIYKWFYLYACNFSNLWIWRHWIWFWWTRHFRTMCRWGCILTFWRLFFTKQEGRCVLSESFVPPCIDYWVQKWIYKTKNGQWRWNEYFQFLAERCVIHWCVDTWTDKIWSPCD